MTKNKLRKEEFRERCICCTGRFMAIRMKFFAKTGHWMCTDCFTSVENGRYMVLAQMGFEWRPTE